jgi:hypothetical protein
MRSGSRLAKSTLLILVAATATLTTEAYARHGGEGGGHYGGRGYHGHHGSSRPIVPVHRSPILSKVPIVPVHGSPVLTKGNTVTTTIVRDHRTGVNVRGRGCGGAQPCVGEGGLGFGQKPAQLPSGYQLPRGGQVRDHRHHRGG